MANELTLDPRFHRLTPSDEPNYSEIIPMQEYLQYCMGHEIENKRFRRNDLTDEYYLHVMKELLEKSHRVNYL